MVNAINIITTIKTKHDKSSQLRMVSCVSFCRWAIRTMVYKSKHNVCSQLSTFISANFQKCEREAETSLCQSPALTQTLGWTMTLCKCLFCRSFFYEDESFWATAVNVAVTTLTCSPLWNNATPLRQKNRLLDYLWEPSYSEHHYILKRKNDPDFQNWFNLFNSVRSCHVILQVSSA